MSRQVMSGYDSLGHIISGYGMLGQFKSSNARPDVRPY